MSKQKLPTFGDPVWVISENDLSEKVKIAGEYGSHNALLYYAAEAIFVKKIEYDERFPGDLTKVVINKGLKAENDPEKDLELRIDLNRSPEDRGHTTVFIDEAEAQEVARRYNEAQKKICKKLVDTINMMYSAYDPIIESCKVPAKVK